MSNKGDKKHPGGRPSKYCETLITKSRDYLANYERYEDMIPSIAGLAVVLGVRRETLHVWAKEEGKEESSAMTTAIMAKAKIHGLISDKHEHSGKNGKPLEFTKIVRVIVRPANPRRKNGNDSQSFATP